MGAFGFNKPGVLFKPWLSSLMCDLNLEKPRSLTLSSDVIFTSKPPQLFLQHQSRLFHLQMRFSIPKNCHYLKCL